MLQSAAASTWRSRVLTRAFLSPGRSLFVIMWLNLIIVFQCWCRCIVVMNLFGICSPSAPESVR
ncbi:MAG: hypothetical protein CMJ32_09060 [Phycisphaerae bacterium]|nr:hypothetical protein [Phycisphaerae bacterium]